MAMVQKVAALCGVKISRIAKITLNSKRSPGGIIIPVFPVGIQSNNNTYSMSPVSYPSDFNGSPTWTLVE